MDKDQIISFIKSKLESGSISKNDLIALAGEVVSPVIQVPVGGYATATPAPAPQESHASKNLVNIFYGIGAIIVLAGIAILISQYWEDIGFMGRILVTLGISFATYFSGMILRGPGRSVVAQAMFTISASIAPLGVYVMLHESGINFDLGIQAVTASGLFVFFGVAQFFSRKNILSLILVGFATWAYYSVILDFSTVNIFNSDTILWATIFAGFSYILLGYGLSRFYEDGQQSGSKERNAVRSVLYAFGTLGILVGGISLGGIWDLLFVGVLFAIFYTSVFLKSRSMLIFAALFLIGHIFKITGEYFIDSIGWPVALVVSGFAVMGVGYATFYINKSYISNK